jgi:hypothetical protein
MNYVEIFHSIFLNLGMGYGGPGINAPSLDPRPLTFQVKAQILHTFVLVVAEIVIFNQI